MTVGEKRIINVIFSWKGIDVRVVYTPRYFDYPDDPEMADYIRSHLEFHVSEPIALTTTVDRHGILTPFPG